MRTSRSFLRNILASVFTFALATFVFAGSTFASTVIPNGTVLNSSNNPVSGATVTITCNSNVINTTTDSNGEYSETFANGLCNPTDTVFVQAEFNGETGSTSSLAGNGNLPLSTIILAAIAVPEFGLITGLVAAAGSGFAYLKMKRKMA